MSTATNKKYSYAVLPEPDPIATAKATPTGTSHTLTVTISRGKVKISNPNLPIENGDTVDWDFGTSALADRVSIQFAGVWVKSSTSARLSGSAKVRAQISEEKRSEPGEEHYSVLLDGKALGLDLGDAITTLDPTPTGPSLVIAHIGDPPFCFEDGPRRHPPHKGSSQ